MTSQIKLDTQERAVSKGLQMPEPIDFGFDEMVKAKSKAVVEFEAEVERRVTVGGRNAARYASAKPKDFLANTIGLKKCAYDQNVTSELAELTAAVGQKHEKNRK